MHDATGPVNPRRKRGALFVPLDVNFPDDPKIMDVGLAGAGLYAMALCLAKRLLTDGKLTNHQLYRLGADEELIDRLVGVGLFVDAGDAVRIAAWLDHNPSAESVLTPDKGRALALARWHDKGKHAEPVDDCPKCPKPQVATGECVSHPDAYADVPKDAYARDRDIVETETETPPPVDRNAAVAAAVLVVVDREQSMARTEIVNVGGWRDTTRARVVREQGSELHRLAYEHPDWTPEQLADAIATPTPTPAPVLEGPMPPKLPEVRDVVVRDVPKPSREAVDAAKALALASLAAAKATT